MHLKLHPHSKISIISKRTHGIKLIFECEWSFKCFHWLRCESTLYCSTSMNVSIKKRDIIKEKIIITERYYINFNKTFSQVWSFWSNRKAVIQDCKLAPKRFIKLASWSHGQWFAKSPNPLIWCSRKIPERKWASIPKWGGKMLQWRENCKRY